MDSHYAFSISQLGLVDTKTTIDMTTFSLLTNDDEESINIFSEKPKSTIINFLTKAGNPLNCYTVQEWEDDELVLCLNAQEWMEIEKYENHD